jgi:hypothetical protein
MSEFNDSYIFDPQKMLDTINITDPEELQAHFQIQDVKKQARERRRKLFKKLALVLVVVVAIVVVVTSVNKSKDQQEQTTTSTTQTLLDDPPSDLSVKCSATQIQKQGGYQVCQSLCEISECCTVPQGYALSCKLGNEAVCPLYLQYCVNLDIYANDQDKDNAMVDNMVLPDNKEPPPIKTPIDTTETTETPAEMKQRIDDACQGLTHETVKGRECESLCQVAACCSEHDANCEVDCHVHDSCQVVFTDTKAETKLAIDEACQGLTYETAKGRECENLCQVAACCEDEHDAGCHVDCHVYNSCQVVFTDTTTPGTTTGTTTPGTTTTPDTTDTGTDNTSSSTKEQVDDACQNHSEATLCKQVCEQVQDQVGACCFGQTITGTCSIGNGLSSSKLVQHCRTYASCSVLFPSYSGNSGSGTTTNTPPQPSPNLAQVCQDPDPSQRTICIAECNQATCCHAMTEPESCLQVHPGIVCDDFSPCNVLYGS